MEDIPTTQTEGVSSSSEPTAKDSANQKSTARRTHWIAPTVVAVTGGIILTAVVSRVPGPVRTFVALSAVAGVLVVGGLVTLIVLIPAAGSNPDVKTEFHSSRAAYLCIITGLILFGIVTIGAVIARVMLTVGGHY